jgi:hypothetical protein
MTARDPTLDG